MTLEQESSTETSSRCEICEGFLDIIYHLPLKHPEGKLNTRACKKCAEQSGAFCLTHQRPHRGFRDGTTVCEECIVKKVETDTPEIVKEFFQKIEESPHREKILKTLERQSEFLFAPDSDLETSISRAIATVAFRFDKTTEEIIEQVCEEGPELIFPHIDSSYLRFHPEKIYPQSVPNSPLDTV